MPSRTRAQRNKGRSSLFRRKFSEEFRRMTLDQRVMRRRMVGRLRRLGGRRIPREDLDYALLIAAHMVQIGHKTTEDAEALLLDIGNPGVFDQMVDWDENPHEADRSGEHSRAIDCESCVEPASSSNGSTELDGSND